MKVCIIGGGPSGIFLAKYISPYANSITIYEKSTKLGGLYNLSRRPKLEFVKNIQDFKNVQVKLKSKITPQNFGKIEQKHDIFVVATGGVPNYDKKHNLVNSLDIIKNVIKPKTLGQKVCIIGMGNVALDVCRKIIKKVCFVDIYSRCSLYLSKFKNSQLREISKKVFIQTNELDKPKNVFEERRYNIINNSKPSDSLDKKIINLRFNTRVKNINKKDGKYVVTFNDNMTELYDSVISSYGFKPNPLVLNTKKPVYQLGWCEKAYGNINDALHNAKKLAKIIVA